MRYIAESGECLVIDEHGNILWCGKPERYEVVWAAAIPGTDDGWVLYNYYHPRKRQGAFENLVRIRPDGSIVLRAELAWPDDVYVTAKLIDGKLIAQTFSCWEAELDVNTGRVVQKVFTK